jgi:thiamine pyrophosphokinase
MRTSALIVGAAPTRDAEQFYRDLIKRYDLLIAADAGGEWCVGLGRVPDVTVGDFDSSARGAGDRLVAAGSRLVEVPVTKDLSDLDLCVREARALGVDDVAFAAAFSERPDHTLAAVGSVVAASDLLSMVLEPAWTAWTVGGAGPCARSIPIAAGRTFSVVSPTGARGVTIEGGRYPLVDGELGPLSSLGLSNIASGNEVSVHARVGCVIVLAVNA